MELEGNSNSATSVAFLKQLRERYGERLNVIWDNAPAHRGERTPEKAGIERAAGESAGLQS